MIPDSFPYELIEDTDDFTDSLPEEFWKRIDRLERRKFGKELLVAS